MLASLSRILSPFSKFFQYGLRINLRLACHRVCEAVRVRVRSGYDRKALGADGKTSLDTCQVGQQGRIARVLTDSPIGQRLLETGFLPGEHFRVVRLAPFGDPMAVEVKGTLMALRKLEAGMVLVWLE